MSTVLFVTRFAVPNTPAGFDIWNTSSGHMGLEMFKRERHKFVFVDFGDVGKGLTGARLSMEVKKMAIPVSVNLLVTEIHDHQRVWAQRAGAGILVRSSTAIKNYLLNYKEGLSPTPTETASTDSQVRGNPDVIATLMLERLQEHTRMGPARNLIVKECIRNIAVSNPDSILTINQVALRVAMEIPNLRERNDFLKSFPRTADV